MTWHCPDCGGLLDEDAGAMWCPAEQRRIGYTRLAEDG